MKIIPKDKMKKLLVIFITVLFLAAYGCSSHSAKPAEAVKIADTPKEAVSAETALKEAASVSVQAQTVTPPVQQEIPVKPAEAKETAKPEPPVETIKIGVIDLQKVAEESKAGKRATDEYNASAKSKQAAIDEKRKNIENLRADLEIQKAGLSDKAFRKKLEEIERLETELERFGQDSEKELGEKYDDLYNSMLQEIIALSAVFGEKEKFILILDKGQLLYGSDTIDATDAFIMKYDEIKQSGPSAPVANPGK